MNMHYDQIIIENEIIFIFTNLSARAGCDTRSIFKRSLTGLNSAFSFSSTSCFTKAEEPSLLLLFTRSWRENNWIHTFPKGISAMWNAISLVEDLNSCRRVHFLRRPPPQNEIIFVKKETNNE